MIEQYKLQYIKESWRDLMESSIFRTYNSNPLEVLLTLYSDPRRKYHNLNHIWHCLQYVELKFDTSYEYKKKQYDLLRITIWFHDAIYTCSPDYDEDMSQKLMISLFPDSFEGISDVCYMIDCTKNHGNQVNCLTDTCEFFLDADMSILSSVPILYKEYSKSIIDEYQLFHPYLEMSQIIKGRKEFLSNLLSSKKVMFDPSLNKIALLNIEEELITL